VSQNGTGLTGGAPPIGRADGAVGAITLPKRSGYGLGVLVRLCQVPSGLAGVVIVGIFVAMAIFAPWVSPHNPLTEYTSHPLAPPSAMFPLGTDDIGRDLLSRLIYGSRPALYVGVVAVAIGGVVGVVLGVVAGFLGGIADAVLSRIWDALFGIPVIVLAFSVVAAFGLSLNSVVIAVALGMAPTFARLARASTLRERGLEYVQAYRGLGASNARIMLHILPNIIGPLIVQVAFAMSVAVVLEASLSFLGLGVQPPTPSWGNIMYGGRDYLSQAPLYGLMPGVFITIFAVGLNLLGEGLRRALSVRETSTR
jgi:peptide/nickel transport system permease protein